MNEYLKSGTLAGVRKWHSYQKGIYNARIYNNTNAFVEILFNFMFFFPLVVMSTQVHIFVSDFTH